jgi:hypothetical protein
MSQHSFSASAEFRCGEARPLATLVDRATHTRAHRTMHHKFALLAATFLLTSAAQGAAFTSGNLVVYRIGDGSTALSNNATPVFLEEISPNGTSVQTISLPTVNVGNQRSLMATGTSTSEGFLNRSVNGACIVLTGFNTSVGSATTSSASSTTNRVIGSVNAAGAIDTSTAFDTFSANSIRSATSTACSNLWAAGGGDGVVYTTLGSTTATPVSNTFTGPRQIAIFDGQLYASNVIGATRIGTVGTGTPTASSQTISALPGNPSSSNLVNGFFFADLSTIVSGVDTLYVAYNSDGLEKFSLVGGTWVSNGIIANSTRGLTGVVSGTTVTLYATTVAGSNNALVKLTDASGHDGAFTGSATTLLSAGTNRAFAGVTLAPVSCGAGSYFRSGDTGCTLASPGYYVNNAGATSQTACALGKFQPNAGATNCIFAMPGNFVNVNAAISQTQCSLGTFQPNAGAINCNLAQPGNYVNLTAAFSQTQCALGTFQPDAGAISCNLAQPGNYVDVTAALSQTQCALGRYQPNSGAASCIDAAIGFFVANTGAANQTACGAGRSSTLGATACSGLLNIDFSDAPDEYSALIDGLMLMRHLNGVVGSALTQGATGTNARRDAALAASFIAGNLAQFDVDGDSQTLAQSDGVMIVRRLLGFSGAALTANAKLGTRTDQQIQDAIDASRP